MNTYPSYFDDPILDETDHAYEQYLALHLNEASDDFINEMYMEYYSCYEVYDL